MSASARQGAHNKGNVHGMSTRQPKLQELNKLEMWANAQRGGRPAEYRRRPLINTAKFG